MSDRVNRNKFLRQWRLIEVDKIKPVEIIGAGSIGSWLTLELAKLGAQDITVYDFDTVEEHNGPNQIYRESDMGRPKVEALKEIVEELSGLEIETHQKRYDGGSDVDKIVICAVDSIEAREDIFNEFIYMNLTIQRYWDCRMGGEESNLISIKPSDIDDLERYKKKLFDPEDAADLPCGAQSVGYNTRWIANFTANQVKCHAMDDDLFLNVNFSWSPYMFTGKTKEGKFYSTMTR